jgi:hypothetical protein
LSEVYIAPPLSLFIFFAEQETSQEFNGRRCSGDCQLRGKAVFEMVQGAGFYV